jgi:hypothetical protein
MLRKFLTQADDEQFKFWMVKNSNGFYLNEGQVGNIKRGAGGMILHMVSCHHLGNGEGVISTTYAKVAADSPQELRTWAESHGLTVVSCSSCKPD